MKILVFAGPTISRQEIQQHLDATILPPPAQGDLLSSLDKYCPQAMGIIDMAFPRSAWVSEVHYALRSGVAVYGAGAQGALRAVELQDYGMKGLGSVYADFASGTVSEDAAILACFTEQEGCYTKTSESLVNVTATLRAAHEQGLLNEAAWDHLAQRAGQLHWKQRRWDRLLLPEFFASLAAYEKMCDWIQTNAVDVQKQDAIALLRAIVADKEQLRQRTYRPADRYGVLDKIYRRERKADRNTGSAPLFSVAHHAAINHPRPLEVNFNGMNRDIVVFFAERMELEPTREEVDYEWTVFRNERSLDREGVAQWCHDNDMTAEAMDELIRKNALCRKMHQWMTMKHGMARATGPFLDELKMRGEYPHYADSAAKIETSKAHQQEKYQADYGRFSLKELLVLREKHQKKPLPWPAPYDQASRVMGIPREDLFYELRRERFHEEQTIAALMDSLYGGKQA